MAPQGGCSGSSSGGGGEGGRGEREGGGILIYDGGEPNIHNIWLIKYVPDGVTVGVTSLMGRCALGCVLLCVFMQGVR